MHGYAWPNCPIQTRLIRRGTQRVREYRPPPCYHDCGSDPGTGLGHGVSSFMRIARPAAGDAWLRDFEKSAGMRLSPSQMSSGWPEDNSTIVLPETAQIVKQENLFEANQSERAPSSLRRRVDQISKSHRPIKSVAVNSPDEAADGSGDISTRENVRRVVGRVPSRMSVPRRASRSDTTPQRCSIPPVNSSCMMI